MFNNRSTSLIIALSLAIAVAMLFLGAPINGAFDWSDAPRHALNGVFIKDLVADMPLSDPVGYAYAYYAKYPALTILFYPPLFYVISAPFYALFGVSHETALAVVALHYIAFSWGSWRLFRFWLPTWQAAASAGMLIAAPEIAFWGRQVMLEIPAFAFMIWSAVLFTRYRRDSHNVCLYWAVVLLALSMYTKISTGFLGLAFFATLLAERRGALLRDRHIWLAALLGIVTLIPLVLITIKFGQANVQSVAGIADSAVSRTSLSGWLWYARQLPGQLGWPLTVIAGVGVVLALARRLNSQMARGDTVFWVTWLIFGYVFFSAIDLKEARHSIFILPPLVFAAAHAIRRLAGERAALPTCALMAALVAGHTVLMRPVHYVQGYQEAAQYVAIHAPKNSSVLFSGYRDGSFVFNMRTQEKRSDLSVVRADKLLLKVAVRRELGVEQKSITEKQIAERINELGIHYVVMQPKFWDDLEAMKRFERTMHSSQFREVARIATPSNYPAHEKELVIYQNLGEVGDGHTELQLDLPIIGRSMKISK